MKKSYGAAPASCPSSSDGSNESSFLLELYKSLRAEIDRFGNSFETYAISSVIAAATSWSWILTHRDVIESHPVFYFAPALCAALFGLRVFAIMQSVVELGAHLARIEAHFNLNDELGWEMRCAKQRALAFENWKPRTRSLLGLWQWMFWIVLIVANLAVAISYCCSATHPPKAVNGVAEPADASLQAGQKEAPSVPAPKARPSATPPSQ